MMMELFPEVINMSITASVAIGFVVLARMALRKAPKVFSYALWSVVLFRLLCPVSVTVDFSVFRLAEVPASAVSGNTSRVEFVPEELVFPGEKLTAGAEASREEEAGADSAVTSPANPAGYFWMAGMGAMLLWGLGSLARLRRKVREAAPISGNVWEADGLNTAFVMGLIRPRIYLPSGLEEREREFILLHEKHHIRRLDHLWKLAAYGALCVHWFNPLVWLAFYLAERDMEMSCDEAVLKALGSDSRCDYSQTLLRLSSGRKWKAAMPLAFGEGNVKERVVNVLNWKKPRLWVSIVCGVVCVALLAACGGNPGVEITEPPAVPETTEPVDQAEYEREQEELEIRLKEMEERHQQELAQFSYTVDVELTDYANIQMELPQGWIYENVEPELETSARGVRFWPSECPEMCIELCWHPTGFGVCGTGLEEKTLVLDNGESASLGYYDGSDCMSFCAFGRNYAAVNVSAHDCWDEYGETVLAILKSVDLNQAAISEERAIALIRDWVQEEWTLYRSEFDIDQGVWTFRFYEHYDGDAVDVICVDHEGNCWRHGEDQHHQDDHHSGHHHGW